MSSTVTSLASSAPPYQDLGLASGMNDSSIIQSLVALQQVPIVNLQAQVSIDQTNISQLGTLTSDLTAFQQAVSALSTSGLSGTSVTSNNTAFTATTSASASPGSYSIQVTGLAQPAQALSQEFSSSSAAVTGGTLNISVNGTAYSVNISDGETLANVADAINAAGAPVSAVVLNSGSGSYLSIGNINSGYTVGQPQSSALQISETTTGSQGQALNASITQQATNATFTLNNITFTRTSNTVTDALPGVTLNLQSTESSPETLTIASSASNTEQNLQSYVSAYNALLSALNAALSNGQNGTAVGAFAGDGTLTTLLNHLQSFSSTEIPGLSGVDSLASLGVQTAEDGSLSIDTSTFDEAFSQDPAAASDIFSQPVTGLNPQIQTLVTEYTAPITGFLAVKQQGLQSDVTSLNGQVSNLQTALAQYQSNLTAEFTAMESTVASLNSTQQFLNENEGLFTGNNSSDVTSGAATSSKVM